MAVTTEKYIYSKMLERAERSRIVPNKTEEARQWFRNKAMNYRGSRINQTRLFEGSFVTNAVVPGKMYMFVYDAKTKESLPYWDAFPVIFPVSTTNDGFYGLNLHYLPPVLRAKLMDALYSTANNQKFDDSTRLNLSYNILKGASSMGLFKHCFKKYLHSHTKSRFIYVEPKEWDIAMFLPLQRFQKATAQEVWRDAQSSNKPARGSKRGV